MLSIQYQQSEAEKTMLVSDNNWINPIRYSKNIKTQIHAINFNYQYLIMKNKVLNIGLGSRMGVLIMQDNDNVTNTRIGFGTFLNIVKPHLFKQRFSIYSRLCFQLISNPPGIIDANPALIYTRQIGEFSFGLKYDIIKEK